MWENSLVMHTVRLRLSSVVQCVPTVIAPHVKSRSISLSLLADVPASQQLHRCERNVAMIQRVPKVIGPDSERFQ